MLFHFLDALTVILLSLANIIAGIHIVLTRKEPASALCWIAVCFALPGFGLILYLIFGVNRITNVGHQWQSEKRFNQNHPEEEVPSICPSALAASSYSSASLSLWHEDFPNFLRMKHLGDRINDQELASGCHVEPLFNGIEAYPEMITEINKAQHSVYLATYIFGTFGIGQEIINALVQAHKRGVEVRVLIDGVGAMYSWPTAYRKLRKLGVPVALFLPPFRSFYYTLHLNLRSHRKLLIVDGETAFTGGMNIHDDNYFIRPDESQPEILDIHFKIKGPVIGQMQDTFVRSWYFATGEVTHPVFYFDAEPRGQMSCRGVTDGPTQDLPKISLLIRGALCSAKKSIKIMTPYLILDQSMRTFFTTAALRGVKVEIIMPQANNLAFVQWASESLFPTLIKCDIDLYYRTGNFAHTKILIMDDQYVLLGSSNIDNRSMYLNFEYGLEVYSPQLASQLIAHFEEVKSKAKKLTQAYLQSRTFRIKLRNAFLNLFSPYM